MMQTPAQILQVAFRTATLDESIDPKQAPPGTLLALRNGVWTKAGRVEKRPGTVPLPTAVIAGGSLTANLQKVWCRDNELAATDGASLFSYVPAQTAWKRVQAMPALDATWTPLIDTAQSVRAVDIDATATYRATAWTADPNQGLYLQVEDAVSGARIVSPVQVATGVLLFRVLIKGSRALLLWQESFTSIIKAISFDLTTTVDWTTIAALAPTSLKSDAISVSLISSGAFWDAVHNGNDFTIFYKTTGNILRLVTYNTAFAQQATNDVVTVANAGTLTLHATPGEFLYAAYSDSASNAARVAVHSPSTLAQSTAPTTVYNVPTQGGMLSVVRETSTSCVVACTDFGSSDGYRDTMTMAVSSTAVVVATSRRLTRWSQLAGKLFSVGGRVYVPLVSVRPDIIVAGGRVSQNTTFVVEVPTTTAAPFAGTLPHKLVATISPRTSTTPLTTAPCSVPVVGAKAFVTGLYVASSATSGSAARAGILLVALSSTLSDPWRSAPVGHSLVVAGGSPGTYDGRRLFELNFMHPPRVLEAATGGSGAIDDGTYLYTFVYEWRDATGLLHRSIPAQPVSVTLSAGGTGSVAFRLECTATCGKSDAETAGGATNALPVMIVPYRTTAGGKQFYRMAVEPSANLITNDAMAKEVAWTDTSSDSDIDSSGLLVPLSTRPLLYTTGGILDEVMPPSFTTCIPHRGRIFGVAGDRRTVWFSKAFTEDPTVFPGFHENLRIVFDDDITALASLDDKLVVFSEGAIWIVVGLGPNASGQGSFEEPVVVQSDVGAIDPRGVVETPDGVMFLSRRGLYLLTRELNVDWIGRSVRDQLDAYPTIVDARLVPHRNQIRFSCVDAVGTAGVTLAFDYVHRFWSVFDYWDGFAANAVIRSTVVTGGTLYLTNAASVVSEANASWLDRGSTWVTLEFELMLRPLGPIAWQHIRRLQLLGERVTHHDLRLRLAFDDRAMFSQDFTFPAQMVAVNNDCPTVRIGSQNGANPRCKALRVRVTDATPTDPGSFAATTGRGGWFSAIGLELIPKPGLPRHGARFSKV